MGYTGLAAHLVGDAADDRIPLSPFVIFRVFRGQLRFPGSYNPNLFGAVAGESRNVLVRHFMFLLDFFGRHFGLAQVFMPFSGALAWVLR